MGHGDIHQDDIGPCLAADSRLFQQALPRRIADLHNDHGLATDPTNLIFADDRLACLKQPLIPGAVGKADRLAEGRSAAEDVPIRTGSREAGIEGYCFRRSAKSALQVAASPRRT